MKLNHFKKRLLLPTLVLVVAVACKREIQIDTNAPAYQIAESEKLSIPAAVSLPNDLPKGNSRVVTYFAEGVQKYKAKQKEGSPSEFVWVFVAPRANLYDSTNGKVGTHSAGPTWQLTGTTDSIFGAHFSTPKIAPSGDPASIDWLLLTLKKEPTGIFANVSYIQRIATKGGKAPSLAPTSITDTIDVQYTAVYRFTKKNQ